MAIPVVVSPHGFPVRPVDANAPEMIVAKNGIGMPITITDLGIPFIVRGLDDPVIVDLFALTSDDDGEILVGDDGEALAVTQQTIETVEELLA